MATKTKRSQKSVFAYQQPAIEAAAKARKTVADAFMVNKVKRELSGVEQTKATKLQEMIGALERDEHVQNRKLKTWLSEDEFAKIDEEWEQEQTHRSIYKDKPELVQEYESIVAEADFYFNRSEHYSMNGNHVQAKKFNNMSESRFEDALERLGEIIGMHPELRIWFDRETESSMDNDTSIDTDSIPRVVTSRSTKNRAPVGTRTIRDVKLGVLQDVLRNLQYKSADKSNVPTSNARLRTLLQPPDDDLI